jgi:hypothetical protein
MKVNFSLPKTQLMQIAASCTEGNAGGGRSFAPGSTHVNYNQFLRQVEAVLKVATPPPPSHGKSSHTLLFRKICAKVATSCAQADRASTAKTVSRKTNIQMRTEERRLAS